MNVEAAHAEIVDEMSQPISHRRGGDIDAAVNVLLAEYDRRVAELEQARSRRIAVLALHRPEAHSRPKGRSFTVCEHCTSGGDPYTAVSTDWPCPTVAALGGES